MERKPVEDPADRVFHLVLEILGTIVALLIVAVWVAAVLGGKL